MKTTKQMTQNLIEDITEGRLEEDTPAAIAYVSHLNYLLKHGDLEDQDVKTYITLCHYHGLDSLRYLTSRSSRISGGWLQAQREKLRQIPRSPIAATIPVHFPVCPFGRTYTAKDKVLYSASAVISIVLVAVLPFVA